jgi:hypothetical protein
MVDGTLSQQEDFSGYGKFGPMMALLRDPSFEYQQLVLDARERIEGLDVAGVLLPKGVKDAGTLKASRERVRAAILEVDRVVVKSQDILTNLQKALGERMTSSSPDEKASLEMLVVGLTGGMTVYRDRWVEMESYVRQSLVRRDDILAFLERKLGHYTVGNETLNFEDPDDAITYESAMRSVRELIVQAQGIFEKFLEEFRKMRMPVPSRP